MSFQLLKERTGGLDRTRRSAKHGAEDGHRALIVRADPFPSRDTLLVSRAPLPSGQLGGHKARNALAIVSRLLGHVGRSIPSIPKLISSYD